MRDRRALFALCSALLAALVLASVASAATSPTLQRDKARIRASALTGSDVPAGFALVFRHLYTPAEIARQGTWAALQLQNWKYEAGFEVQFDLALDAGGPAQISSDIGAYGAINGAKRALAANAAACQTGEWHELPLAQAFGDAAHLCTLQTTVRGFPTRIYFVAWTVGRFKGAVTLSSLASSTFTSDDAMALARTQLKRMKKSLAAP